MAKQKGIVKLDGTIGDITFYKSQDGYLAREKGSLDADRIKTDPNFARTRENGAEFGSSAAAGKVLRDALRTLMLNAADNRVTSRLSKVMTQIKNLDSTSVRGARSVGNAMAGAAAKALLNGFNFNKQAVLGAVLFKPYTYVQSTGVLGINNLTPLNDMAYPPGATHMTITGALAQINFAAGTSLMNVTNSMNMPIDGTVNNVVLTPVALPPVGPGVNLFVLKIEFFQSLNGVQYALKDGSYNPLSIIEVY